MELQSEQGTIDILYADEARVSEEGYVPYGWQFPEEDVFIESARGSGINCFAMLSRDNKLVYSTTEKMITSDFIVAQLDAFSLTIKKPTVVVMDNARVHTAEKVKALLPCWQKRELYVFYLPTYSPQLNITERLWKELKARWLCSWQPTMQNFWQLGMQKKWQQGCRACKNSLVFNIVKNCFSINKSIAFPGEIYDFTLV